MKYLLLVLLGVVLCISCTPSEMVVMESAKASPQETVEAVLGQFQKEIDKSGYRFLDNRCPKTEEIILNNFDEKNRMTATYFNKGADSVVYALQYSYKNNSDYITEVRYLLSNELLLGRATTAYDDNGNETVRCCYKSQDILLGCQRNSFDSLGNHLEKAWYDAQDSFLGKLKVKYNQDGLPIEKSWYDSKEVVLTKAYLKYNEKGLLAEERWSIPQTEEIIKLQYSYNEKNELNDSLWISVPIKRHSTDIQ